VSHQAGYVHPEHTECCSLLTTATPANLIAMLTVTQKQGQPAGACSSCSNEQV